MAAEIGTNLQVAHDYLMQGRLVAIPTETVYGLAALALNPEAVARIFEAKNRPTFDPLIVHLGDASWLERYAGEVPEAAQQLAEQFWPGPLTLVLPKKPIVLDLVTSGLPTAGFRVPNHPLTLTLLQKLNQPVAAPSANPFGYVSPTTAQHVADQLGDRIGYILDGGPCQVGVESTIVGFPEDKPVVYRLGGIAVEDIEAVIGSVEVQIRSSNPAAPGMLDKHYSPGKTVQIGKVAEMAKGQSNFATLSFQTDYTDLKPVMQFILSPSGDLAKAAARLFQALRDFDQSGAELLLVEEFPNVGLGRAINDRLSRAATR